MLTALGEFLIEGGWPVAWEVMGWPVGGGLVCAACMVACWRIGL